MAKKRTPIKRKSPLRRSRKPIRKRFKACSECGYRYGVSSYGLCVKCADKKKHAPLENGEVTKEMVHTVFSWLVRTLYPHYCHACKKPKQYRYLQCCHMIPRGNMIITWDLRNCYPGCKNCNYFDPTHEILLAAECDRYWGPGTAEHMAFLGKKEYKWTAEELAELYKIFINALEEAQQPGANVVEIRRRVLEETKRAA